MQSPKSRKQQRFAGCCNGRCYAQKKKAEFSQIWGQTGENPAKILPCEIGKKYGADREKASKGKADEQPY
jgi:hypothetical protein